MRVWADDTDTFCRVWVVWLAVTNRNQIDFGLKWQLSQTSQDTVVTYHYLELTITVSSDNSQTYRSTAGLRVPLGEVYSMTQLSRNQTAFWLVDSNTKHRGWTKCLCCFPAFPFHIWNFTYPYVEVMATAKFKVPIQTKTIMTTCLAR